NLLGAVLHCFPPIWADVKITTVTAQGSGQYFNISDSHRVICRGSGRVLLHFAPLRLDNSATELIESNIPRRLLRAQNCWGFQLKSCCATMERASLAGEGARE
ncbi:MAG: hypothetical protein ACXW6J_22315, partial [Candidatus Binatia bacterium]